jgi:hypothetical protein
MWSTSDALCKALNASSQKMGQMGRNEDAARRASSSAVPGSLRGASATFRGFWIRIAFVCLLSLGQCFTQVDGDTQECSFFGQGTTGRADRIVRDRCPSSRQGGTYYFIVDVLPGSGCTKPHPLAVCQLQPATSLLTSRHCSSTCARESCVNGIGRCPLYQITGTCFAQGARRFWRRWFRRPTVAKLSAVTRAFNLGKP